LFISIEVPANVSHTVKRLTQAAAQAAAPVASLFAIAGDIFGGGRLLGLFFVNVMWRGAEIVGALS
jgi:hypothetical protein